MPNHMSGYICIYVGDYPPSRDLPVCHDGQKRKGGSFQPLGQQRFFDKLEVH
jgi:hypothetical protein